MKQEISDAEEDVARAFRGIRNALHSLLIEVGHLQIAWDALSLARRRVEKRGLREKKP